jgi:ribosome-associated protein
LSTDTSSPVVEAAPSFDTEALALAMAEAAWNLKARNVRVLDVRRIVPYADFLVLCHGTSDRHAEAIAEHVIEDLRPQKVRPLSIEGVQSGSRRERAAWILVDFADAILHVFGNEDMRAEYNLESIFSDAPRLALEPPADLEDPTPQRPPRS